MSVMKTSLALFAAAALLALLPTGANAAGKKLDPKNPDEALQITNKVFCANKPGEHALYWWQGSVYSRRPGEKDRHLFDVQGMNVRQCARLEDKVRGIGFRSVSRELLLYTDKDTGQLLKTWKNPWSGEDVEVIHVANDPVNSRGPTWSRNEKGEPTATLDSTIIRGSTALNGGGAARLFYENPLAGPYQEYIGGTYHATEFLTSAYDLDQAMDPSTTAVADAVLSWNRISSWLPWMKMRGRDGVIVISTYGMRLQRFEDLPQVMQDAINTTYPAYKMPPPTDDARPNETSWTYFKKVMEEKAKAKAP
jgi:Protein of unknown function (DUF1838)